MPWDDERLSKQQRSRFLNAILERVGISDAPAIAVAEDE